MLLLVVLLFEDLNLKCSQAKWCLGTISSTTGTKQQKLELEGYVVH